jgi:hypothetical protein
MMSSKSRAIGMRVRFLQMAVAVLILAVTSATSDGISVDQTTSLIRLSEWNEGDAKGWAVELHDVLMQREFDTSPENVCAAIAVTGKARLAWLRHQETGANWLTIGANCCFRPSPEQSLRHSCMQRCRS